MPPPNFIPCCCGPGVSIIVAISGVGAIDGIYQVPFTFTGTPGEDDAERWELYPYPFLSPPVPGTRIEVTCVGPFIEVYAAPSQAGPFPSDQFFARGLPNQPLPNTFLNYGTSSSDLSPGTVTVIA